MIVLFTDYGMNGPYLGQVEVVLQQQAPNERIINLLADAPRHNPKASAYLLEAFTKYFSDGTIFFCVVDPDVGKFKDHPVVIKADNKWLIGPDNGLFDIISHRSVNFECWKINWRPKKLSMNFHGRDLYAPVCAMIANGIDIPGEKIEWQNKYGWPDSLSEIIYVDNFGNCMTGLNTGKINIDTVLIVRNIEIKHATTFSDVSKGNAFWYENSYGLVEIAINQGCADQVLNLSIGEIIRLKN